MDVLGRFFSPNLFNGGVEELVCLKVETNLKSAVRLVSVNFDRFVRVGKVFNRVVEIQFPFVLRLWARYCCRPSPAVERIVSFVGVVVAVFSAVQRVAHWLDISGAISGTVVLVLARNSVIHQRDGQNTDDEL